MNPTAVYRGKPEITSNRRQGRIATIRIHGCTQGRTARYRDPVGREPQRRRLIHTLRHAGAAEPELPPRIELLLLQSTYIAYSRPHDLTVSEVAVQQVMWCINSMLPPTSRSAITPLLSQRARNCGVDTFLPNDYHKPIDPPATRRSNQKRGRTADVDLDLSAVPQKDTDHHRFNILQRARPVLRRIETAKSRLGPPGRTAR